MINLDYLKESIDCRDLIARDLGKPRFTSQKSASYACPLHHETRGASLVVYRDGWICHGKCQKSGDALGWLQIYHGLNFHQAAQALAGNLGSVPPRQPAQAAAPEPPEPPPADWQQRARQVLTRAQAVLWNPYGEPGREYLRSRGINERMARAVGLGFIPGEPGRALSINGLGAIYPGIVIPWFGDGHLWALNVRRINPQDDRGKYLLAQGSRRRGALFGADQLTDHVSALPLLIVEGEFDAILARQCADDLVTAVTLGSAQNQLAARWIPYIARVPRVLIATDSDPAGEKARARLAALSSWAVSESMRARFVSIRVPDGHKDISDYYAAGPRPAGRVWDWLYDEVMR